MLIDALEEEELTIWNGCLSSCRNDKQKRLQEMFEIPISSSSENTLHLWIYPLC